MEAAVFVVQSGDGLPMVEAVWVTEGYRFTVGSAALVVSALGIWDEGQDGLAHSHRVGLWDDDAHLMGSVVVPVGTHGQLVGEFRYQTLEAPVVLNAGHVYRLGAEYGLLNLDSWKNNTLGGTAVFSSEITPNSAASALGFAFPVTTLPQSYVGPSAIYTAVPEGRQSGLVVGGGCWRFWGCVGAPRRSGGGGWRQGIHPGGGAVDFQPKEPR
jgi:hypothetical protein